MNGGGRRARGLFLVALSEFAKTLIMARLPGLGGAKRASAATVVATGCAVFRVSGRATTARIKLVHTGFRPRLLQFAQALGGRFLTGDSNAYNGFSDAARRPAAVGNDARHRGRYLRGVA